MPIILEEDTEVDTHDRDVHPFVPEPESIPASPLNGGGIRHVNVVEETKVNVKEWHISRLPKTSAKCCWAQRALTKKKCTERIVRGTNLTAAPTYTGFWTNICRNVLERT